MYTLGKIIQVRKDAGRTTYCFCLHVQKAYDAVSRNGLWKKLWEIGIRGKMWRRIKVMTECATNAVMLDGDISKYVDSRYFARSRTGMHVVTKFIQSIN